MRAPLFCQPGWGGWRWGGSAPAPSAGYLGIDPVKARSCCNGERSDEWDDGRRHQTLNREAQNRAGDRDPVRAPAKAITCGSIANAAFHTAFLDTLGEGGGSENDPGGSFSSRTVQHNRDVELALGGPDVAVIGQPRLAQPIRRDIRAGSFGAKAFTGAPALRRPAEAFKLGPILSRFLWVDTFSAL